MRAPGFSERREQMLDDLADALEATVDLPALLASGKRVRAIACSSDNLAQGAIAEALDRGMAIPRDLAVMGFGDLEFAAHTTPAPGWPSRSSSGRSITASVVLVERDASTGET